MPPPAGCGTSSCEADWSRHEIAFALVVLAGGRGLGYYARSERLNAVRPGSDPEHACPRIGFFVSRNVALQVRHVGRAVLRTPHRSRGRAARCRCRRLSRPRLPLRPHRHQSESAVSRGRRVVRHPAASAAALYGRQRRNRFKAMGKSRWWLGGCLIVRRRSVPTKCDDIPKRRQRRSRKDLHRRIGAGKAVSSAADGPPVPPSLAWSGIPVTPRSPPLHRPGRVFPRGVGNERHRR